MCVLSSMVAPSLAYQFYQRRYAYAGYFSNTSRIAATVWLTETVGKTRLVSEDASVGMVFPLPFDRMIVCGMDVEAKAVYISGLLLLLNVVFLLLFYKELKISTFDPLLVMTLGLHPVLLLSTGFGGASGVCGYVLAVFLDVSIAGSMAAVMGVLFVAVFLCAPKRGIAAGILKRHRQARVYAEMTLLLHICHHRGTKEERRKNSIHTIADHLHWERRKLKKVLGLLVKANKVYIEDDLIIPTSVGNQAILKNSEGLF